MGITILGTGHHVPGVPVTNDQLSAVMETSDEWIYPRTGIKQRHFVAEGEGVSDLALKASQRALANAGVDAEEVDFIVFATMTPEFIFPGAGGLLGAKLGIPRVPALDIRQQCAAMPFGMQVANGLVATGAAKTILLVGADAHAGFMPWEDWDVLYGESDRPVSQEAMERGTRHRGLAVLFGDGAAAMVLREGGEDRGFLGADLHTDGRLFDRIYIASGGFRSRPYFTPEMYEREEHIPKMQGRDLFKVAVTELSRSVRTVCEKCAVTLDDVDWFIAHQANDRINGAVRQALKLPESKVPSNIAKYGNTSAATIGLLLDELRRGGEVKEGQLICFLALGSGLNWGSVLMRL
ncbi:MAG: 3-oxoacyl-ACP synthase [Sandaracinus sp.]|nr:3-oxoacyl-ACP synthase [Sandaracinus sp.]MAQ17748.1 3-oxoacyl-ACP synthase [Sandaracinus sp.]